MAIKFILKEKKINATKEKNRKNYFSKSIIKKKMPESRKKQPTALKANIKKKERKNIFIINTFYSRSY